MADLQTPGIGKGGTGQVLSTSSVTRFVPQPPDLPGPLGFPTYLRVVETRSIASPAGVAKGPAPLLATPAPSPFAKSPAAPGPVRAADKPSGPIHQPSPPPPRVPRTFSPGPVRMLGGPPPLPQPQFNWDIPRRWLLPELPPLDTGWWSPDLDALPGTRRYGIPWGLPGLAQAQASAAAQREALLSAARDLTAGRRLLTAVDRIIQTVGVSLQKKPPIGLVVASNANNIRLLTGLLRNNVEGFVAANALEMETFNFISGANEAGLRTLLASDTLTPLQRQEAGRRLSVLLTPSPPGGSMAQLSTPATPAPVPAQGFRLPGLPPVSEILGLAVVQQQIRGSGATPTPLHGGLSITPPPGSPGQLATPRSKLGGGDVPAFPDWIRPTGSKPSDP